MEKRCFEYYISSGALKIVFLFICCLNIISVQCQERVIKDASSDPPWPSKPSQFKHIFQRILLSIVFGLITGLICAFLFAWPVKCFVRYISKTPILKGPVVFSPKIPAKTLQSLVNDTQLLGSSPNISSSCCILLFIAVKRLEPFEKKLAERQSKSVKRRIQQELAMLASLRHRNFMRLRDYIHESAQCYLVCDYMPNGSLEDAMNRVRENELQLSWEVRLWIAVGIVKGLQYLHFTCNPRILHYNLKPTNVMLDAEFEPRLADCWLRSSPILIEQHQPIGLLNLFRTAGIQIRVMSSALESY